MVNNHKLFIRTLFLENRQNKSHNPNSGFVICFQEEEINNHAEKIMEAIHWENRKGVMVPAAGKNIKEIAREIACSVYKEHYYAEIAINNIVYWTNYEVVNY